MDDKVYFLPGDLVTLNKGVPNKPTMIVVKKETSRITSIDQDSKDQFQGIRCRWFSVDQKLQEAVFNTKDLIKIE